MRRVASILFAAGATLLGCAGVCRGEVNVETGGESFSFRTSILPILTKAGCNAGACHGAAPGAGGFKLSLLGYDPEKDYERITRELGGRRIDPNLPHLSLFLRKPAGQLEHEGGRKLPRSSDEYQKVLRWIEQGAPAGRSDLRVESIAVAPDDLLFSAVRTNAQIKVVARLSNGVKEDVTSLALFHSNNDGIAEVDKHGAVKMTGPGAASIMVRYGGQVAAVRVALPFKEKSEPKDVSSPSNIVDGAVAAEWSRLGLEPAANSQDWEFLRRVYLDLAGQLPPVEVARSVAETDSLDRDKVIQELLRSEAFTDLWTMHLADLLQIGGGKGNQEGARAYHHWLKTKVRDNAPLDQMVSEILTAKGKLAENGPANFFALASDPRDLAEHASRIFMGTQLACARCHAHPTDRWTQDDYYGFAAFFAGVSMDGGEAGFKPQREILHPGTGRPVHPKPLGQPAFPEMAADPRENLAGWITTENSRFFGRSMVNRVWKKLMGRGLVEPVDDLRPTNPATHPQLLEGLASQFAEGGYDLRKLVATIVSSHAYQLTSTPAKSERSDAQFYSHALVKELPAAVLLDAISDVTGQFEIFENLPSNTRAIQLIGARDESYALDVLGRCQREKPCSDSNGGGGGLAIALHLLNGATIDSKLDGPVLKRLGSGDFPAERAVEELYLAAFSRLPSAGEAEYWDKFFKTASGKAEAIQDFCWVLLNSREFAFNH